MDSGAYTIQEFICQTCDAYLGWKFARAHDGPERWKEGHFVLELDLVAARDDDGSFPLAPALQQQQQPQYDQHQYNQQYAQQQYQHQHQQLPGVHKRTMSADPRFAAPGAAAKGLAARQGVRSLQASPRSVPPFTCTICRN